MFNIGGQEFALIIVLALVVVGPEQLPGLIRKLGTYAAQAREMSSSLRAEFMSATEPMQDTFKEFQDGMQEFQTGMVDLSNSVTDAADVKKWGTGTSDDPVVPRGYSDEQSAVETVDSTSGKPDPWAADRTQPITAPSREKKLEITPPVNPWADVRPDTDNVAEQTEAAAQQLEASADLAAETDEESP